MTMRPGDGEPVAEQVEALSDIEELAKLEREDVPEDERSDVDEALRRRQERDLEIAAGDVSLSDLTGSNAPLIFGE
jgi:hypothetical protein